MLSACCSAGNAQMSKYTSGVRRPQTVQHRSRAVKASSSATTIRFTVETPAYWWIAGILLIVAVFAALYWVFRTYGRR